MSIIAIQGIRGSYSEEAALDLAADASILECEDFPSTFDAVRSGRAEYAVVPVENKIVGEISGSVSYLRTGGFREHERMSLNVRHVLAGTRDATLGTIRSVMSHVEALNQCRRYLASRPEWKYVPSPMFWKTWRVSVNGACPIHVAPSPPIWVNVAVDRSIHSPM